MVDPDKVVGFWSSWLVGIKVYSSSVSGLLVSKLFFLGFVVFGLFASGVSRWLVGDRWFGFVLISFGFVSLVDFRLLWLSLKRLRFQESTIKDLESDV